MSSPQPNIVSGVPYCDESCSHHDGKRCELLGFRVQLICEPHVSEMAHENAALRARVAALEADREAFGMMVARAVYLIYATTNHSAPPVSDMDADDEHLRLLSIVAEVAAVKAARGETA